MRRINSRGFTLAAAACLAALYVGAQTPPAAAATASQAAPIPLDQLGAVASSLSDLGITIISSRLNKRAAGTSETHGDPLRFN
jgi:hypothetical protein